MAALVHALGDWDPDVRRTAVASLGQLERVGSQEAVAALVRALGNKDSDVRRAAAEVLGRLGQAGPEVVAALTNALSDENSAVRRAAAESLGQLERVGSQEAVAAPARAPGDLAVRRAMAGPSRLRQVRPEVMAALVRSLRDRDLAVRWVAAGPSWLWQAEPEAAAVLARALGARSSAVRQGAAKVLGQLEVEDGGELRKLVVALNRGLHDSNDNVRLAALESIRALLDGRPIPGYRWTPLRVRRERARRWKQAGFWLGMVFVGLLVALVGTWLLTGVNPNSFVVRFLLGLSVVVAFGAGLAQILGRALRSPVGQEPMKQPQSGNTRFFVDEVGDPTKNKVTPL